jgi:pyruvate dehydrogenase E2 component (dihydrolipoamide acetyltransferase)
MVSEGDQIEKEDPIAELESEKAAFEVPSPEKGTIKEVKIKQGETVKVGQVVAKIETSEAPEEEKAGKTEEEKEEKPKAAEKEKEQAEQKPSEERKEEEKEPEAKEPERTEQPVEKKEPKGEIAPAAPSVRRLAREIGVDIHQVSGSGPGGRIFKDDVKQYAKEQLSGEQVKTTELPDFSKWGDIERQPMTQVRKITATSTMSSWQEIPHVTQFGQADVTELERFRKRYSNLVDKAGGKLTVTGILLKVVAQALVKYPRFNASLDMNRKEIIYKKYLNIGVAVDTERGLLVPVIKDVDKKGLLDLSVELTEKADKTRNKKLNPSEMEGGNFTISNLGGIGGTNFTPIVYSPQVAILGVSRAEMQPKYVDDKIVPRLILPLALSYDHRIIDGADGARFLKWIVQALEDPMVMALEGGM